MSENAPDFSEEEPKENVSVSRRNFLKNAGLAAVGVGLGVLGVKYASEHIEKDSTHHGQGQIKEKRHIGRVMVGVSPNIAVTPESYAIIIAVDNIECFINVKKEDYDKYWEGEKVEVTYTVDGTGITNPKATELKKIDGSDKIIDSK